MRAEVAMSSPTSERSLATPHSGRKRSEFNVPDGKSADKALSNTRASSNTPPALSASISPFSTHALEEATAAAEAAMNAANRAKKRNPKQLPVASSPSAVNHPTALVQHPFIISIYYH